MWEGCPFVQAGRIRPWPRSIRSFDARPPQLRSSDINRNVNYFTNTVVERSRPIVLSSDFVSVRTSGCLQYRFVQAYPSRRDGIVERSQAGSSFKRSSPCGVGRTQQCGSWFKGKAVARTFESVPSRICDRSSIQAFACYSAVRLSDSSKPLGACSSRDVFPSATPGLAGAVSNRARRFGSRAN
jgi:hypothetical protein